jgi:hypothetical protein
MNSPKWPDVPDLLYLTALPYLGRTAALAELERGRLAGMTLAQAKVALRASACNLGALRKPKQKKGRWPRPLVVTSSTPAAGAGSATGEVSLTLGPKARRPRR